LRKLECLSEKRIKLQRVGRRHSPKIFLDFYFDFLYNIYIENRKEEKMEFFTADQHFDHKNIIEYCNRPFSSVDEMNNTIINNHNSVVGFNDEVYHLGDFTFIKNHNKFLSRLNGKHFFIRGNHDHKNLDGNYEWVKEVHLFKSKRVKIYLSHYAGLTWPESHKGAFHLFGHSHGKVKGVGRSMDVGVDVNNFTPVSFDEIKKRLLKIDHTEKDVHYKAFENAFNIVRD
jgi:calcineurin-like phosphoesterase family protein